MSGGFLRECIAVVDQIRKKVQVHSELYRLEGEF